MSTLPCIIAGVSSSAAPAMVIRRRCFAFVVHQLDHSHRRVGPFSAAMRTTSGVSSSAPAEGAVEFSGSAVGSASAELSAAEALSAAEEALSGALTWGALCRRSAFPCRGLRQARSDFSCDTHDSCPFFVSAAGASSRPAFAVTPGSLPAFRTEPIRRPSGRQGQR